jgi:multiple sugar transport system substrate-binding protein
MEAVCAQIKEITRRPYTTSYGETSYFSDIPLGYDSESNWFITMTQQLGTPYTSSTGDSHFLFNTQENRDFVKRFREWYENGYVITKEIFGGYTSNLFTETSVSKQKCYMCIAMSAGASYQCPDPETDPNTGENVYPFEVGVAPIPQIDVNNPKVYQQGPSLCLFKKSPQEQAATWLFAKWLTTNVELQAELSITNGFTPVIESVKNNNAYAEFLASASQGNKYLQAAGINQTFTQMDAYFILPAFCGSEATRNEVGELLQNCFLHSTFGYTSVDAFIEEQFKKSIDKLKYEYGY